MKQYKRNRLVAFVLAFLFGPIGYLYASTINGLILLGMAIGFGLLHPALAVMVWLLGALGAPFDAGQTNEKLRAKAELMAGN
jgi:hypothetical protein